MLSLVCHLTKKLLWTWSTRAATLFENELSIKRGRAGHGTSHVSLFLPLFDVKLGF